MSNTEELSIATEKNLNSLYDIVVHGYENRKRKTECHLGNHRVYLLIQDVSKKYASSMENSVYYQSVCLECGKMEDFKMSISDRRKVIDTRLAPMEALLSFYEVRKIYLKLKDEKLSDEEIAIK